MAKLLINGTHGEDDPERATLAFVVANVAASADQETIVFLTIDGVWLATKGYAERIHKEGFQRLARSCALFLTTVAKYGPVALVPSRVGLPMLT